MTGPAVGLPATLHDAAVAGSALPDPVGAVAAAAARLERVALDEPGVAALMDRIDTKFVLPAALVPHALARCGDAYLALEVAGHRLRGYRTTYYDTADLALYHAHHAGRATRRKVRLRTYGETGESFFEVKLRTNAGRTVKSRVPAPDDPWLALRRPEVRPLLDAAGWPSGGLRPVLDVAYLRLTLAGRDAAERVSVDLMLGFAADAGAATYPEVAIAEVKQHRHHRSCFLRAMRELGCRPVSISKYCLGVARLHDDVKQNRYKPVLRRIHQTAQRDALAPHAR